MPPIKRAVGPIALSATLTTDIYDCPGLEEVVMLHVVNKTDNPRWFSLWIGATGANVAGTEWFSQQTVAARSVFAWPYRYKLVSTDFIVGGADVAASLSLILVMMPVGA